jgi:hydrophobe/amphiphile efflux-1 (HAE1) family protein
MNISAWSIRHPVPAVLLFAILCLAGLFGFRQMGIQNFPDIDFPMVNVTASLEGASPTQLETDVARKLENQIATIDQIKHINTTITQGMVNILIEFELEKNGDEALNQIRNAIDVVRPELPGDLQPPTVAKINTAGDAFVTYTLHANNMSEEALSWFIDYKVDKKIRSVPGVGKVQRIGGAEREINVFLDPNKINSLGVSPQNIANQLTQVQKNYAAGDGRLAQQNQSIRTLGSVANVSELANLVIPVAENRQRKLSDIAVIQDGTAEKSSIALFNGEPVIAFQITRTRGASEIAVAAGVEKKIEELRNEFPHIKFTKAYDTIVPVRENYHGSMNMLYEGAILAILVVFLFLKDWRATLVSATALPLSIIPTFAVMYLFGFSINLLTLLSLALVVGILVDDAIVEVENIMRHLRMGKTPIQAAIDAADEIGLAVVATTFSLVAVFLPTAFMSGVAGKFFKQFGLTAAIAVLVSLLVARLLTPMMAAYLLHKTEHQERDGKLMHSYLKLAAWCQTNRRKTLVAAFAFFVISLMIIPLLPTGFVPAADQAQTRVTLELPPGTRLEDTLNKTQQAVALLQQLPDVKNVFAAAGSGASGGNGPGQSGSIADQRKATLTISLTKRTERDYHQSEVERQIRNQLETLSGVRVTVGGTNSGESLQITLAGDDPHNLHEATRNVEKELRTIPSIGSITSGLSLERPEIRIIPNYEKAAELGITSAQLAQLVRFSTFGDYAQNLAKLNLPERQIPIRIRLDPNWKSNFELIKQLRIPTNKGTTSLQNIANVKLGSDLTQIDRRDRSRQTTIKVELGGRSMGEVMQEISLLPSLKNLPNGVQQMESGETEQMTELFQSFGIALLIGLVCIYIVLVLLFHDFLQPITILAAIPLSAGGALLALLATNSSLSLPSIIGVIMLTGVVTKNSILLVEYAVIARREQGMNRLDALMDACHKRARPIVMTTIAMGFGMLPTAIGLGADPSFRGPMAIVVIGGLITSTLLSLLVIPVVFTYIDDFMEWIKHSIFKIYKTGIDSPLH